MMRLRMRAVIATASSAALALLVGVAGAAKPSSPQFRLTLSATLLTIWNETTWETDPSDVTGGGCHYTGSWIGSKTLALTSKRGVVVSVRPSGVRLTVRPETIGKLRGRISAYDVGSGYSEDCRRGITGHSAPYRVEFDRARVTLAETSMGDLRLQGLVLPVIDDRPWVPSAFAGLVPNIELPVGTVMASKFVNPRMKIIRVRGNYRREIENDSGWAVSKVSWTLTFRRIAS